MDDKQIRIGIDAGSAFTTFERLKQSSRELAEGMVDDAVGIGGSYRDITKRLEDNIKLLERTQSMDVAEQRMNLRDKFQSGDISAASYAEMVQSLNESNKEAKLQTELTRGIIDAILGTARKETEENRQGVLSTLSRTAPQDRTFAQRYQASLLGMDGDPMNEEEKRGGRFAGGMRGYGMAILGAKDPVSGGFNMMSQAGSDLSAMGGGFAVAGVAMALGAVLGKKLWDATLPYYKASGLAYATTGVETDISFASDFSKYGVTNTEFAQRLSGLARSRRSGTDINRAIQDQILLEKGIGLDIGAYNSVEQLSVLGGETGMGRVQSSAAALRKGGMIKDGDYSSLPDFLQIMIGLGKEQVSKLGKVDMGINTKMVAALGSMDETLKRSPEALTTMVNAVRGGLSGSRSPQTEALQYSVLSKMRPGASMFEMMEMKENPFSTESQQYLPEYLQQLHKMSGGNKERFFMNIMQQFGLSASMSRKLGSGFLSGQLGDMLQQDFLGKEGIDDVSGRAAKATPKQVQMAAWTENQVVLLGDNVGKIVTKMDQIIKVIQPDRAYTGTIPSESQIAPYLPPQ